MIKKILNLFVAAMAASFIQGAMAEDVLKPFVLASKGAGTVQEKVDAAKTALQANGFTIAGSYSPYPETTIIVVTNDEMKSTAAKSEHGGFGAAQRVSVTKAGTRQGGRVRCQGPDCLQAAQIPLHVRHGVFRRACDSGRVW